jgi:hypothetical protein
MKWWKMVYMLYILPESTERTSICLASFSLREALAYSLPTAIGRVSVTPTANFQAFVEGIGYAQTLASY